MTNSGEKMPENGEKTYWVRYLVGILWAGIAAILMLLNNRVCATEDDVADTRTEIASIKKDIEYIKMGQDDQKQTLKEIATLIRGIK
jgi:hypothetical protein